MAAVAMQKAVKFMHDRGKDKDGKMEFHKIPKKKDEIASLKQYQEKLRHISEFAEVFDCINYIDNMWEVFAPADTNAPYIA